MNKPFIDSTPYVLPSELRNGSLSKKKPYYDEDVHNDEIYPFKQCYIPSNITFINTIKMDERLR